MFLFCDIMKFLDVYNIHKCIIEAIKIVQNCKEHQSHWEMRICKTYTYIFIYTYIEYNQKRK